MLVLEVPLVALDETLCCPDEDSVVIRKLIEEGTYETADHARRFDELLADVRPREFRLDWRSYFDEFGNIAYEGVVPFSAVTRYVLIDALALRDSMLPIFKASSPPLAAHIDLLDHHADTIAFMFDGTPVRGVSNANMWRLQGLRLQHVDVRRLKHRGAAQDVER